MKPIAFILAIGFIYSVFYRIAGFGIPCPIRAATHLYCPGCGISRMFAALLSCDIPAAFSYNCVVFCLLPFYTFGYIIHCYLYIRYGKRGLSKAEDIFVIITLAILLVFAFLRNIFPIDILVP